MSEQNNNSDKLKSIPCKYITGKVLGKGHFSVVKEVCHIETKQIYACKVISKKLMEKRAEMVRNEIVILQKISSGHENIITLHDYFETTRNVYLCFELCTGGEMLAWVRAKESYYEV
jgi:calcium/calmodulin-dependent protein kinase I